jgi:hypothetical protein
MEKRTKGCLWIALGGNLDRFSIPFWLLRMAPDGNVSFGDEAIDELAGREKLTVRELEAFGPGCSSTKPSPTAIG